MSNPYQSPQAPSEPGKPRGMTVATIGAFLGGFVTCGVVAYLAPLPIVMFLILQRSVLLGPDGCVLVMHAGCAILGPAFAALFWALSRECNRPFSIGAITAGLSAFLIAGCRFLMLAMCLS